MMTWIDIQNKVGEIPDKPALTEGMPLFRLGFRVFFLAAGVWGVLMVLLWTAVYTGHLRVPNVFTPMQWHGREMLFGFTGAVIAGFLLTAAGNWTGRPMPSGRSLQLIAGGWLAGRLLPFIPGVPLWVTGTVDVLFYPFLGVVLACPILEMKQLRNMPFPLLLAGLGAANVLSYRGLRNANGVAVGTELALYVCLGVIVYMGGRVIPGFTRGRHPRGTVEVHPRLERICLVTFGLVAVGDVLGVPMEGMMFLFVAATVAHGMRLAGWYTKEIWREPLLWILHVSYGWLVFGLLLKTGWTLGVGNPLLARHAFTAGTIGAVTLGMMCRVTLGHTGRPMRIRRFTVFAFVLVNLAAFFRVVMPLAAPTTYRLGVELSGICWVAAFGIYLVQYGGMLFQPRQDGLPG